MGLTKYKIGQLVTVVDERNNFGIRDFYGININKEFMPTVANTEGLDEAKYKVVRKNRFVYSGMQTGRDECIRISMYNNDTPILISPAYTTFEVTATDVMLPLYFFMKFLSKEKDRYGAFCSDGSIRSNLDWEVFCDIDIVLPPVKIQQKYIDIYNAMLANQQSYERGLEDLRLACEAYIEKLQREVPAQKIRNKIAVCEQKNDDLRYGIADVRGVSIEKKLIKTKADMMGVGLAPYYVIPSDAFVYVPVTSRNGGKISIAYNDFANPFICSAAYIVFRSLDVNELLPAYLNIFLNRTEFDRYARFHSWGSARETFDWEEMCDVEIPIPDIKVQHAIAELFTVYNTRKKINEQLKGQIRDICPILIKGSLEEGK